MERTYRWMQWLEERSKTYQRHGYLLDLTASTCLHLEAGLYIVVREPERALQFAYESSISPCVDDGK